MNFKHFVDRILDLHYQLSDKPFINYDVFVEHRSMNELEGETLEVKDIVIDKDKKRIIILVDYD